MNYKELFHIAMQLISSPARAWEEISLEDRRKVFTAFVYPMIGLCGLSVFIGSLVAKGWGGPQSFQYAMTQCCAVAVSLFGGYFLAAYLINGLRVRMFAMDNDIPLVQQFAGYALVVSFMLKIIIGILPDSPVASILYCICGVGRKCYSDENSGKRPFKVYHSFFHVVNSLSGSDRIRFQ